MKRIFTLCCMMLNICMTTTLLAIPAKPGVQTVEQPDGTTITILMHGDEYFHFTTTEDGYLIRQNANGVYEYAELTAEKVIKPIGVKAYSIDQRTIVGQQLPKHAIKATETFQQHIMPTKAKKTRRDVVKTTKGLSTGNVTRVPLLLVQYRDVKFNSTNTPSAMAEMMNGDNYTYDGATGSVKKYFMDQSNGLYVPEFDMIGPITLSKDRAYYGDNGDYGYDYRAIDMVEEALRIADADLGIDFSQYDNDGDGYIEAIGLIYAGYGETSGIEEAIWSHASAPSPYQYDGKYISMYACSAELAGYGRDGIGCFCHEFSHALGLPDYYDLSYGANYENNVTPGIWSLMDAGNYNNRSNTPPNYSAFDKYYFGWITPTVLNTPINVTLEADGVTYYAVTADGTLSSATEEKDVWYLENRQQTGWDAYLPAHGMLVTKFHYDMISWNTNSVNSGNNLYYDIIEADGIASGEQSAGITFPGSNNVRSFTPVGDYSLKNITETSGVIHFDFMGEDNGENPEVIPVTGITLSETSLALEVGDTHTLTATVVPTNATNTNCTWLSSAANIVSVDNNGKLTALTIGNATITVKTEDGGRIATCTVTVNTPNSNDPETREVPFHDSFESDSDWIITDNSTTVAFNMQINKIADIATVSGNYYLVSGYDPSAARNAWAIMRNGLSLKAGQEYTVSAYVFAPGYSVAEQIQFTVGASSAISNQTDVILNLHEKYESWTLVKAHFTPATDGTYYFGIHHCTPNVDVNAIAVDDFTIVEKDDTALKNVESYTSSARKVLENGTIYIIRPNGNKYTVDGRRVM